MGLKTCVKFVRLRMGNGKYAILTIYPCGRKLFWLVGMG